MHPETISNDGIELIKRFEGFHKVQPDGTVSAYRCAAGVWTIGWGSTKGVRSGQKITVEEAEETVKVRSEQQGEPCHFEPVGDKYVVYRSSDNKVMKSINYFRPNLKQFFTQDEIDSCKK